MKRIAVLSADGRVARKVIEEAVERGFEVVGFGRRDENTTKAQKYIKKDLFDLTSEDLRGFDAVVDAFGVWEEDKFYLHTTSIEHLTKILKGSDTRLLIVGGAGSLFVNKEHTKALMDGEDFPDAFKSLASAMGESLKELRKVDDVKWTYISPAADFQADGERTGRYVLSGEEFTLNEKNESIISYADYAIAMVDEIEKGSHIKERISVVRA